MSTATIPLISCLQGEEAACLAVTHSDLSVMSHAIGHGALTESRRKQQV